MRPGWPLPGGAVTPGWRLNRNATFRSTGAQPHPGIVASSASLATGDVRVKVLVVDDDADLLDLMTYALRREGYNVLTAIDGQQALQRWEAERTDIILLDGNLPKLDGFEVCRRIRHGAKTPII